jgi:hypothetical protein
MKISKVIIIKITNNANRIFEDVLRTVDKKFLMKKWYLFCANQPGPGVLSFQVVGDYP